MASLKSVSNTAGKINRSILYDNKVNGWKEIQEIAIPTNCVAHLDLKENADASEPCSHNGESSPLVNMKSKSMLQIEVQHKRSQTDKTKPNRQLQRSGTPEESNGNYVMPPESPIEHRIGEQNLSTSVNNIWDHSNSYKIPTTLTGSSCFKGASRSSGSIHVQFESPNDSVDSLVKRNMVVLANSDNSLRKMSDSVPDGNTPLSSLRKNRKKRRQPSGSSSLSIGSTSTSTSDSRTTEFERNAPDGGWGWVVVFASFMVHCIADGITMSFGVLYVEFLSYFKESRSLTSWVGSLFMAIPLLAGPLASYATDHFGCRTVTIWGSVIASIGFFLSAFANSLAVLFITIGVITGVGLAVCYVAAIVIVAFYFEKRRSLATGIAVAGSGIGTFVFAPVIQHLIEEWGWRGTMIILSGIFLNIAVFGCLMRDLAWTKKKRNRSGSSRRESESHSSDTLRYGSNVTPALPSLDELRRLVQSGEASALLSPDESPQNFRRSASLILLPTFLNPNKEITLDLISCLSTQINAYEIASKMYPHLLSPTRPQTTAVPDRLVKKIVKDKSPKLEHMSSIQSYDQTKEMTKVLNRRSSSYQEEISKEACKILQVQMKKDNQFEHSIWRCPTKTNFSEIDTNYPSTAMHQFRKSSKNIVPLNQAGPLRNMRMNRQSMTFRGAMLNIHRYRLRASSCPDIYRNSIITIAEARNQTLWSCFEDMPHMLWSCINMEYFLNPSYLIFGISNFVLYMFYDTVYMYMTDYSQGVHISADDSADLISAIGVLNCIGMVIMGYLGDQSWSSPLLIYNVSMVICGTSVIIIPFLTNYWTLALSAAAFGLFISANYALTAAILVDIISLEAFSKSYGLLLLIQGIANLIGPPLVGLMADTTGGYVVPFVVSGVFIVICGLMLGFIPLLNICRKFTSNETSRSCSPVKSV